EAAHREPHLDLRNRSIVRRPRVAEDQQVDPASGEAIVRRHRALWAFPGRARDLPRLFGIELEAALFDPVRDARHDRGGDAVLVDDGAPKRRGDAGPIVELHPTPISSSTESALP